MPEEPLPKHRSQPGVPFPENIAEAARLAREHAPPYAELEVTSNFTFLTGASHPDELVYQAALLGHRAIAATDTNSLAGIVRFHVAAKEAGMRFIPGCRLTFTDVPGLSILVYPTSKQSYGGLCRLLTIGKRRAEKGKCDLAIHDLIEHQRGLIAIAVPPAVPDEHCIQALHGLRRAFDDDRLSIALSRAFDQGDDRRIERIAALADHVRVPLVVTGNIHYHAPERRPLQDVLTCIRHRCTIEDAGYRLHPNAERHLKPAAEMHRLFAPYPRAIARTVTIAERTAGFSLDQLRYEYPDEVVPDGSTPQQHLEALTWQGRQFAIPTGCRKKCGPRSTTSFGSSPNSTTRPIS